MLVNKRNKFLPYSKQFLAGAEYRAVRRILKSPFLTQGPAVLRFENALKEITAAPYAVAVANGTMALDLAVRAIKIQRSLQNGALALTTPNTFIASSNALLYNQLTPVFCDISPKDYNLSMKELERILAQHNTANAVEDAVNHKQIRQAIELLLPVHFAGQPVDMPYLWQLAQKYNLAQLGNNPSQAAREQVEAQSSSEAPPPQIQAENLRLAIIEDAAHALGSYYPESGQFEKDRAIGSCLYSDACCFSFHPVKTATTAEGGAITCRDPELYETLLLLRNHGITRNPEMWLHAEDHCEHHSHKQTEESEVLLWYNEMQLLGYNARLSDLHAALGTEQLRRVPEFAQSRLKLAKRYDQAFENFQWLRTPLIGNATCPHLYVVQIDFAYLRLSRNAAMHELRKQGIGSQVHYIPVPMHPFYQKLGYSMANLENTQAYYRQALSLPLYPSLKTREQDHVIHSISNLAELH